MHIMEGYLSWQWCLIWWIIALPFLIIGTHKLKIMLSVDREALALLGVTGDLFYPILIKTPHPIREQLPSDWDRVIGRMPRTLDHCCRLRNCPALPGTLLAHGGLSTLGANLVSMGIVGPFAGFAVYRLLKNTRVNIYTIVFIATALADLITYVVTSFQLATGSVHPATGSLISSFIVYSGDLCGPADCPVSPRGSSPLPGVQISLSSNRRSWSG